VCHRGESDAALGRRADLHNFGIERVYRHSHAVRHLTTTTSELIWLIFPTCRTRFHYDNKAKGEKNWCFPLEQDLSLRAEVDDVPPFTRQLKHFISAIRGEVEPNCSGKDGLKAVFVMEAMFKSLATNAPVVVEQLE
jgi:predicted dehydrogenase